VTARRVMKSGLTARFGPLENVFKVSNFLKAYSYEPPNDMCHRMYEVSNFLALSENFAFDACFTL
jgi:hypothetical protein